MGTDQRATVELLYRVSRAIAASLDLRVVLARLIFATIDTIEAERGTIVVLDDNENPIDSAIVYGEQVRESTTLQLRETVERGLAGWVVRNRQSALLKNTSQDERWLRRPDDAEDRSGAKSAICVPLLAREKLVGVMTIVHPRPGAFKEEHLALVQSIADQAGVAVLNARLYAEVQRQARVTAALAEGAKSINSSLRMDEVLQRILNETSQALMVDIVSMALVEPETGNLVFRAGIGEMSQHAMGRTVSMGSGIIGHAARQGQPVIVQSVAQDARYAISDQIPGVNIHAMAVVPLVAQGSLLGVLVAVNPLSKTFDADAALVLEGLGGLAGAALQNAQFFERLQVAHQRYQELFEDSIDPIFITDWNGMITEANRQAAVITSVDPADLHDQPIETFHRVNIEKTGVNFAFVRRYGVSYEGELFRQDGHSVPVEVYVRRVVFNDTESIQWILRDITARKELDTLRDDLAATIYHDLRSPLANIVSSLEILNSMLSPEEAEIATSVMGIAQNSVDRIQRLINSLLDINRLEAGQPLGNRITLHASTLVNEAIKAIDPLLEGRQQTVTVEGEPMLPNVLVDEDMLKRVLINLLENASKYTPSGSQISVGGVREGESVRLWVADNGPGIPLEDQKRIFDKYARVKKQGGPRGFGIGLAFCRLAVEAHGGRIWVESEPGHGSKFILTLPVVRS